jgi:hypothetical protein
MEKEQEKAKRRKLVRQRSVVQNASVGKEIW